MRLLILFIPLFFNFNNNENAIQEISVDKSSLIQVQVQDQCDQDTFYTTFKLTTESEERIAISNIHMNMENCDFTINDKIYGQEYTYYISNKRPFLVKVNFTKEDYLKFKEEQKTKLYFSYKKNGHDFENKIHIVLADFFIDEFEEGEVIDINLSEDCNNNTQVYFRYISGDFTSISLYKNDSEKPYKSCHGNSINDYDFEELSNSIQLNKDDVGFYKVIVSACFWDTYFYINVK